MPSKYKLTYFNIRGRAEMTRLIFAAADQPYEDVRIDFKDWPDLKTKTPQGQMPLLEVGGKVICQSFTIARFIARELNFYGKTNFEAACIDQILDTLWDLNSRGTKMFGRPYHRVEDKDKMEEARKDFFSDDAGPRILGYIEKAVEQFGSNGYAASDSLSVADLAIYAHIEFWRFKDCLDKYPKIAAVMKKVEENKNVAKYLKERPDSQF